MQKMDLVHEIRAAKRAHVNWVSHAHALIEGLPLEQNQVPVNATECKFGVWYYGIGQMFFDVPEFKAIEEPHMALHATYMKIFQQLFGHHEEEKVSFLQKFFGRKSEAKEDHREEARKLLPLLKKYSDVVVHRLEDLEKRVVEMPDEELERLAALA